MREGEMIYTLLGPEMTQNLYNALDSLNEQHLSPDIIRIKDELSECMDKAPWLLPLLAAAAHAAGSFDFSGQPQPNFFREYDYLLRFGAEAQKHIGSIALQAVENFGLSSDRFQELVESRAISMFDSPWPPTEHD
jgi:hypothetical protein